MALSLSSTLSPSSAVSSCSCCSIIYCLVGRNGMESACTRKLCTPVIYQWVLLFHIIWLAGIDKSSSMCMLQKMTHHKGFTKQLHKNLCSALSSCSFFVLSGWQEWNQHVCTNRGYILTKQQYQFLHSSKFFLNLLFHNVWMTGIDDAPMIYQAVQIVTHQCSRVLVVFAHILHSNAVQFFAVVVS